MLINFPNQLTSEEEQLLKKIAKMKKKKKLFSEKKSTKDTQSDTQSANLSASASVALKRPITSTAAGKQIDAKEAAKKLIQSGAIKFETENKEKGFKRSCSRKDDSKSKAANLNINPESNEANKQISYSSVTSPSSVASPSSSTNSPYYNSNKFSFSSGDSQSSGYSQSPSYNQRNNFRKNSYQHNQTPNSSLDQTGFHSHHRFQQYNNNYNQQNQQQNGVSLFIKANNVTEELLRSLFNANVSQAKLISIDVKTNFAFVTVDTKEAAENAINELNGKTFQDNLFSVSLARPRKQFNRNNSYGAINKPYNNQNHNNNNNNNNNSNNNQNQNQTNQSNSGPSVSSPSKTPNTSATNDAASRQLINYEDV